VRGRSANLELSAAITAAAAFMLNINRIGGRMTWVLRPLISTVTGKPAVVLGPIPTSDTACFDLNSFRWSAKRNIPRAGEWIPIHFPSRSLTPISTNFSKLGDHSQAQRELWQTTPPANGLQHSKADMMPESPDSVLDEPHVPAVARTSRGRVRETHAIGKRAGACERRAGAR